MIEVIFTKWLVLIVLHIVCARQCRVDRQATMKWRRSARFERTCFEYKKNKTRDERRWYNLVWPCFTPHLHTIIDVICHNNVQHSGHFGMAKFSYWNSTSQIFNKFVSLRCNRQWINKTCQSFSTDYKLFRLFVNLFLNIFLSSSTYQRCLLN